MGGEAFQLDTGDSFNMIVCLQMCAVYNIGVCTYMEDEASIRLHIPVYMARYTSIYHY